MGMFELGQFHSSRLKSDEIHTTLTLTVAFNKQSFVCVCVCYLQEQLVFGDSLDRFDEEVADAQA